MNRYVGDFAPGKTVRLTFNTNKADGTPITLAGTPAVAVYKDSSTTESTTGVTLAVDFDARTGMHQVVIDTSADGTFYAAASDFRAVLTAGTVDSISVVGAVVGGFSLSNRSALRPTTADRTLDVSAGGEAGLDWANVGSPTTTLVLSGTTLGTLTTYTGNTPQTGDNYALASGTSGFVAIKGNTAAIVAKLPTNSIADETLILAATSSILSAVGTPAQAAQIPANFTTALFASAGVFSTGALANAPTGGGSAQTGDVFGLLNPLVATGAFTAPALANVPKTGYALTSAYDPAKTAAQAGAAMTLTSGERDSVADAFLDRASGVEPGETPRQWMRKVRAVLLGVSTAAGVFKRKDKTTTSVTATLDGQGARTDVVDGTN
jgi:hypothetical protein